MTILTSCTVQSHRTQSESSNSRPAWIDTRPISSSYFIGIGKANIDNDPVESQKQAEKQAKQDISEQIKVRIVSDVKLNQNNIEVDGEAHNTTVLTKNIQTLTDVVLEDLGVEGRWKDPISGTYYCKVVLEKQTYYDRINKEVNDAIAIAAESINLSPTTPIMQRLNEMYNGMTAMDAFLGNAMKTTVNHREVILNVELPRRLQQALDEVKISPNTDDVALSSTAAIPDSIGVTVLVNGHADPSVAILWTASKEEIGAEAFPMKSNGLYPVHLTAVPASAGKVTITASLDLGQLIYHLLQRGFRLPSGAFTISRETPRIYIKEANQFVGAVVEKLASNAGARSVKDSNEADLLITANCESDGEPILIMSIFQAKVNYTVKIESVDGVVILNATETVVSADAQSPERAKTNTQKVAIDKAVERIEQAL